jgi:hypothetical protein
LRFAQSLNELLDESVLLLGLEFSLLSRQNGNEDADEVIYLLYDIITCLELSESDGQPLKIFEDVSSFFIWKRVCSFRKEFKTTHYRFFVEPIELGLCRRPVNKVFGHYEVLVI